MIFGHEGNPRAGKSYEAVKFHVLPALKAGRHVFFRLNGVMDNVDKLAAHLEMPEADVRALLHPMGNAEVHSWLVCDSDNDGSLTFPSIPSNSLVVVDEAHEYWPVGRNALPDRVGNFFAKHGHISVDIVLMTQDLKELHRSVVRRMAKKNFYAKLDALGKDESYSVRFYTAPLPGKWELVGSEKRDYDPAIFAMYHGIQPGVEGNEVYKAGTKTLWQSIKKPAIAMALAVVVGIGFIARFFMGGGGVPEPQKAKPMAAHADPARAVSSPRAVPVAAAAEKPKPDAKHAPGLDYIMELKKTARPRYAGAFQGLQLLEFRTPQGQVVERLTSDQMRGLGWDVHATAFGAFARYGDETLVFTAWPIDLPFQQSELTARRIEASGSPVMSASESQPNPDAGSQASASGSM